jgi:non-heme chloroperoxidase
MQGDDDQIVPYKDASVLQAKLLKHGALTIYPGFPHGMMNTNADVINADILAFIIGAAVKAA